MSGGQCRGDQARKAGGRGGGRTWEGGGSGRGWEGEGGEGGKGRLSLVAAIVGTAEWVGWFVMELYSVL